MTWNACQWLLDRHVERDQHGARLHDLARDEQHLAHRSRDLVAQRDRAQRQHGPDRRRRLSVLAALRDRGGHFRDDYPGKSAEWAKWNLKITRGADGRPKLEKVPVVPLTDEMKQIIEEQKS